jgi:hypothetical protein
MAMLNNQRVHVFVKSYQYFFSRPDTYFSSIVGKTRVFPLLALIISPMFINFLGTSYYTMFFRVFLPKHGLFFC